jgi:hypothetical protein
VHAPLAVVLPYATGRPEAVHDVHRAHVIGLCLETTKIDPFMELVEEVMNREPYASARRVSGSPVSSRDGI